MKKLSATISAVLMAILLAPPAAAGGGNFLQLDDHYVVAGATVVTELQGVYFDSVRRAEHALSQSWPLYASKGWDYQGQVTKPPNAILVGRFSLQESTVPGVLRGNATFTIPKGSLGPHSLFACNERGCTSVIGDMYFSSIEVAESPGHAALLEQVALLDSHVQTARRRIRHVRMDAADLRGDLAGQGDEITALAEARSRLWERLRALERAEAPKPESPLPWTITGAVVTLLIVGVVIGYRRRTAIPSFDDIEDDTAPGEVGEAVRPAPRFQVPEVYDDSMWRRPEEPTKN